MSQVVVKARALLHADLRAIIAHAYKTQSHNVIDDYAKDAEWMLGRLTHAIKHTEHFALESQTIFDDAEELPHDKLMTVDEIADWHYRQWQKHQQDSDLYKIYWYKLFLRLLLVEQIATILKETSFPDAPSELIESLLQFDTIRENESWWLDEWVITTEAVNSFKRQFELDLRLMLETVGQSRD